MTVINDDLTIAWELA